MQLINLNQFIGELCLFNSYSKFTLSGNRAVLDNIITWNDEAKKLQNCESIEVDGRFYGIDIGNYLLYAIAFGWVSDLTYCGNPHHDSGDFPQMIIHGKYPDVELYERYIAKIQLHPSENEPNLKTNEPKIPFIVEPRPEAVKYSGDFNFVSLAQSPNFTPKEADFIIDIFREYIEEI